MRNVIQLFLATNTILLMHLCHYSWKAAHANCFPKILFIKKQTQWSNEKNYWTQLSQKYVTICQCFADQIYASAFGFGK